MDRDSTIGGFWDVLWSRGVARKRRCGKTAEIE